AEVGRVCPRNRTEVLLLRCSQCRKREYGESRQQSRQVREHEVPGFNRMWMPDTAGLELPAAFRRLHSSPVEPKSLPALPHAKIGSPDGFLPSLRSLDPHIAAKP